jgi:hypothetical protein
MAKRESLNPCPTSVELPLLSSDYTTMSKARDRPAKSSVRLSAGLNSGRIRRLNSSMQISKPVLEAIHASFPRPLDLRRSRSGSKTCGLTARLKNSGMTHPPIIKIIFIPSSKGLPPLRFSCPRRQESPRDCRVPKKPSRISETRHR